MQQAELPKHYRDRIAVLKYFAGLPQRFKGGIAEALHSIAATTSLDLDGDGLPTCPRIAEVLLDSCDEISTDVEEAYGISQDYHSIVRDYGKSPLYSFDNPLNIGTPRDTRARTSYWKNEILRLLDVGVNPCCNAPMRDLLICATPFLHLLQVEDILRTGDMTPVLPTYKPVVEYIMTKAQDGVTKEERATLFYIRIPIHPYHSGMPDLFVCLSLPLSLYTYK
jgi:hypothetical protein